jgi:protein SCO1/2
MSTIIKPRRATTALAATFVAIVLLGVGAWLWVSGEGPAPAIGGPFTLEDTAGRPVTDRDLRGSWLLVYFGYTFCPDVCPTTLSAVAGAMDKLGPRAAHLRPVFITVDPQRDTPAVMRDYVASFSPRMIGLTGTQEQIAAVAREYRVYFAVHRTGPGANDYSMDHSSLLYLVGPDGRFVAPIRADDSADGIAASVAQHIS